VTTRAGRQLPAATGRRFLLAQIAFGLFWSGSFTATE
jgi:hypothetical protein